MSPCLFEKKKFLYCYSCNQLEACAKISAFTCLGHRDVAELLLENVANRDCRTKTGITPLFQVSQKSSTCSWCKILVVKEGFEFGSRSERNFFSSGLSGKPCRRSRATVGLWSQCERTIPKQQVSEGSQSDLPFLKILRGRGHCSGLMVSAWESKLSIPGQSPGQVLG